MKSRIGQLIVLVSALVAGIAVFLPWTNWVGMAGVLERSHSGNTMDLGGVPTLLTLVAAVLLLGAALVALLVPHEDVAEVGFGVVELAAAVLAVTPPILLLGRLDDPAHWIPPATAGLGLWLSLIAGVAAGIGAVLVLVMAARGYRQQRVVEEEKRHAQPTG